MVVWREGQATFRARTWHPGFPPSQRAVSGPPGAWLAGWLAGRPAVWPSHPERGANHGSRGRWLAGRETSVRPTHVEGRASLIFFLVVAWIFFFGFGFGFYGTVVWCAFSVPCMRGMDGALIGWWENVGAGSQD
ncbi:hypothetical protein BS50DRAFT_354396 [Corynespora cassiicola Philippines]|uniref:Uncharacterized protein n=1 Tax=Corynespora cassiicola Philippines TaxID=1448308 RepID=A0A2T2NRC8_CORCC|nr:hypothetical protein BS50DRAFT_354396 [Corynespora cassiicola Philippines]